MEEKEQSRERERERMLIGGVHVHRAAVSGGCRWEWSRSRSQQEIRNCPSIERVGKQRGAGRASGSVAHWSHGSLFAQLGRTRFTISTAIEGSQGKKETKDNCRSVLLRVEWGGVAEGGGEEIGD